MLDTASPWTPLSSTSRRVALEVLLHGPLARTELARRLDLSTPSLTRITKPLLDAGVLREVHEPAPRGGGRPLQPLDVDPDLQQFVGIKLTGFRAYGVLTNLRADILATSTREITAQDPQSVVEVLDTLVSNLSGRSAPAAVGVGLGGAVRDFTLVQRAPFLHWHGVDLGRLLAERTRLPVAIANDLDALMEAEHWFGDGRDVHSFAALTIGAGVGGGLVIHDRLVTGPDSGIGLLGHFPLDPLGPSCPEGHRGCADAMLSTEAIHTQAAMVLGRAVTYDEVLDLAAAGDPLADQIVGRSAHAFGTLIAAVANIAQPERILLTGEGIRLAHVAQHRLRAGIAQARQPEASPLDLRILDDDPTLWARGAAAVAIQRTVLSDLPRH
ncbi:ROK family protein [Cellulosimicrobium cellulans]|uniref:ROK family protein n=1 Tax=Cellulosimicrobium cellulans TaxID=1710 RepID=UPI0038120BDC